MLTEDYSIEDYTSLIENFKIDKKRKIQLLEFMTEVIDSDEYEVRDSISATIEACELICLKYKITDSIEKCFIYYLGGIMFVADEYYAAIKARLMDMLKDVAEKLKNDNNDEEE